MSKKTPFDRIISDEPVLTFLIHTDSIADDIVKREKMIVSLLEMTLFPFLQIIFTPSSNEEVLAILDEYSIAPSKYEYHREVARPFFTLNTKEFGKIVAFGTDEEMNIELVKGSSIKKVDLFAGHDDSFDYFIIGKNNEYLKSPYKESKDIDPLHAIELIRILLVNLGLYYIRPRVTVGEKFYHLYRFKKIFYEFQHAWTVITFANGNTVKQEVFDQFDSLAQRLDFISRASDKVSYYALKYPTNSSQDNTLYHMGYLIMLITGVFDDLAWFLNHLYNLRLQRMDVVLKVPINKEKKFYNRLVNKNKMLHDYLIDERTQNLIKLFYPIRDSLQHRTFIKGMRFGDSSGYENNVFALPKQTVDIIEKVSIDLKDYGLVFNYDSEYLFDAHLFVMKCIENLALIVNNTLKLIDWSEFTSSFPQEKIDQIYSSKQEFDEGIGQFLGWGTEPLYF